MTQTDDALKPCPFCGGKPYLANVAMVGCAYVVCTDCRMQSDDGDKDRVATKWNTRADLATQPDLLADPRVAAFSDIIKRAEVALKGVTPGPWAWNVRGFVGPRSTADDQSFGMICDEVAECSFSNGAKEANARFIAEARDIIPELLAALAAFDTTDTDGKPT